MKMCGFVGFCDVSENDGAVKRRIAEEMLGRIKHRGPDGEGYYSDGNVTLGFARLSIIDARGGSQPMLSRNGRYVLCYNGELYNYKDLREELEKEFFVRFYTESDTEVVLNMLVKYGDRALARFRGMFAFVFYDRETGCSVIARDPFGIKPLYYGEFGGCFMFASEIKAFLSHPKFKKELDTELLPYYLQFQYVPTEATAFKGVKRLKPGHLMRIEGGKTETLRYFDLPVFSAKGYKGYSFFAERDGEKRIIKRYKRDEDEVAARLEAVLCKAVERHTVSDVKLGGFLSGGVDSGLICSYARPKEVFSIGFRDHGFDERAFAAERAEAIGASLHGIEADADDFFAVLPEVQYYSDEPYANLSAVPLFLMAREAKKHVGVILSGEGADELFGGYSEYVDPAFGRLYRKLPRGMRKTVALRSPAGRLGGFLKRNAGSPEKEFIGQARIMSESDAFSILKAPYKSLKNPDTVTKPLLKGCEGATELRKKMHLDSQLWLAQDILNKADKMTMASSLELRVPYLDLSVFSISEGCGERLLVRGKTSKRVLRTVAEKHIGREAAFREKKGFPVPFRNWIRETKYSEILKTAFTGEVCARFFESDKLLSMLDAHVNGTENNARVLYTVYAFLVWYDVYFGEGTDKVTVLDTADLFKEGKQKNATEVHNEKIGITDTRL